MGTLSAHNRADDKGHLHETEQESSILIYSPHTLVIKGIKGILASTPGINLIGHATNWTETMLKIYELDPSVLIINNDGNETGSSNLQEAISLIISEFPGLNCLKIINAPDHEKEIAALKLGIKGVLMENTESDRFIECIKRISSGGLWYRRVILERFISEQLFLQRLRENERGEPTLPIFTRRELEIIQMAGKGVKNREIGRKLFISEKTVKHHLSKIFKKLRIKKRGELRIYL
jgi:DNA-binding NarL/FixJ family response regulator